MPELFAHQQIRIQKVIFRFMPFTRNWSLQSLDTFPLNQNLNQSLEVWKQGTFSFSLWVYILQTLFFLLQLYFLHLPFILVILLISLPPTPSPLIPIPPPSPSPPPSSQKRSIQTESSGLSVLWLPVGLSPWWGKHIQEMRGYWSAEAAIMKYHRSRGLNKRNLISHNSED